MFRGRGEGVTQWAVLCVLPAICQKVVRGCVLGAQEKGMLLLPLTRLPSAAARVDMQATSWVTAGPRKCCQRRPGGPMRGADGADQALWLEQLLWSCLAGTR
jgi:hypothetical protein